ncbi:glycoside hydrolase family 27 protein [Nocardia sp. ET3-3]|uniref:Alpha-galactosidase n=1 Tax=Nocardia terrae TaxID=2675851 RepID=A0A7K1USD2_9NOCA|nr:glycoside hydrolase family 27 protein [Nocardia terrae]MVU76808.1 glycoside hydrolase family 27 protein [Nocardia terrae]
MRLRVLSSVLVVALAVVVGGAGCAGRDTQPDPGLASVAAPMGWNSWNSGIALTENTIHEVIDAMVSSGMRDAGYRYVDLDAGWAAPVRDGNGNLQTDPQRFPHGIAALADYAHRQGLFLGLYSSPFNAICGQSPATASLGHETADARTFANWGVDLLKYDWCRTDATLESQVRIFTAMRDALRHSGRRILYSINPNSSADTHAAADYDWSTVSDMTRNAGDLIPLWHNDILDTRTGSSSTGMILGVTDQLDAAEPLAARSRPGYWNDPDMLVAGLQLTDFIGAHLAGYSADALSGTLDARQVLELESSFDISPAVIAELRDPGRNLTLDEQRSHFALWAMLAAPLIAGNDVRAMSEETRALLTNTEVIAVDQDPAVVQATRLHGDRRILRKPLADGSLALALFNFGNTPTSIETTAAAAGLQQHSCYTVRDLWTHTTRTTDGPLTAPGIPAHAVVMLKITPTCQPT